jgi:hypothetical protein
MRIWEREQKFLFVGKVEFIVLRRELKIGRQRRGTDWCN